MVTTATATHWGKRLENQVILRAPSSKYTPREGDPQRRFRSPVAEAGAVEGRAVRPALHVDDAARALGVLVARLGVHHLPGLGRLGHRVERDLAQVALLHQGIERLRVLPLVGE